MLERLHGLALRAVGRLPKRARTFLVHRAAPSFSVGAMCVVVRDDGARLLVRHSYRQGWGVPGGLLKRGEDASTGAMRETREEVGLDVELIGEPHVVVDPRPRRVDVIFLARPAEGADPNAAEPTSPEVVEARWFGADEKLPPLQRESEQALNKVGR